MSLCPGTKKFPCPLVPGQKSFACPAVPLSRDKKISKKKSHFFFFKNCNFLFFFSFCPVAVPGYYGTGRDRLSKSRPGPSPDKISKSRPGPFRGKILSLSHCSFVPGQRRDFCPVVPLPRDNEGTSVPLSRGTRKSRPIGNPTSASISRILELSLQGLISSNHIILPLFSGFTSVHRGGTLQRY